jgi:hypothetical protein
MWLALMLLAAAPRPDARLVGNWQLNGQPFLTLSANGTAVMGGDALKWKTAGAKLVLVDEDGEAEEAPFVLEGDTLTLQVGGVALQLTRAGKGGRLQRAAEEQQPQPQQAPRAAGTDQLSRLLLSSNWCWLRYASGNTYTQKVHFSANGTWQDYSESDIYVSNSIGTAEATNGRGSGGQWAVKNGQLWLSSQDSPQLQPVPLSITRNSNGAPIITADGREYSMCN